MKIVRAAIKRNDEVLVANEGERHGHVFKAYAEKHGRGSFHDDTFLSEVQGFVTDTGLFVDRYEAKKIAEANNQVLREPFRSDEAYSENFW